MVVVGRYTSLQSHNRGALQEMVPFFAIMKTDMIKYPRILP